MPLALEELVEEEPVALALSVGTLAAGALLHGVLGRAHRLRAVLDGFLIVGVGGLCLLWLFPAAAQVLGAGALVWAGLGLAVPWASERLIRSQRTTSRAILGVALLGLSLHNALDGAGLRGAGAHGDHDHGEGEALIAAVVAHQLPVGLLLAATLVPVFGRALTAAGVALVALSTVAGYLLAAPLLAVLGGAATGALQALLAGGLLHVVVDHAPEPTPGPSGARLSSLGALLALGGFALLRPEVSPAVERALATILRLLEEAGIPVLLGLLAAGLLSQLPVGWRRAPSASGDALRVVATSQLGPVAVLLTLALLGWELAAIRVVGALAVVLSARLVAGWISQASTPPVEPAPEPAAVGSAPVRALRAGLVDTVDEIGPWILAGIAVAALLDPWLDPAWLPTLPSWLQVPLAALLALPIWVCASAATPIAAILLAKGVSPGAALAFLLAGPATSATAWGKLRSAHGAHAAAWIVVAILLTTIALGLAVDLLPGQRDTALHAAADHRLSRVGQVAAGLFLLLCLASLARQGPRGFLVRLGIGHAHPPGALDHGHDHDHGPCCDPPEPVR